MKEYTVIREFLVPGYSKRGKKGTVITEKDFDKGVIKTLLSIKKIKEIKKGGD